MTDLSPEGLNRETQPLRTQPPELAPREHPPPTKLLVLQIGAPNANLSSTKEYLFLQVIVLRRFLSAISLRAGGQRVQQVRSSQSHGEAQERHEALQKDCIADGADGRRAYSCGRGGQDATLGLTLGNWQGPGTRTWGMGTRRGGASGWAVAPAPLGAAKEQASVMDSINDDLVLVILDFVDVRQVLTSVAGASHRLRTVTR